MARKVGLGVLWLGLVLYAFLLAPPSQPDTLDLIVQLSTGQWGKLNPVIVALFNLMGIWPVIYASVALVDGTGQKIPAWPFVAGSFGLGAFTLLPYLVLRDSNPTAPATRSGLLAVLESKALGIGIVAGAGALLAYGIVWGDWGDFIQAWQTSRFIHVMSLDFCLLSLLFPLLLGDDMAHRGLERDWRFWLVVLVPLLGPALYLVLRPSLPSAEAVV